MVPVGVQAAMVVALAVAEAFAWVGVPIAEATAGALAAA